MCTVVVRWSPGAAVLLLAVRDELTGRAFDDPGDWWRGLPTVVGGRDRQTGGTWCATDVATGTTALVLNGTQKLTGDPGSTSRGVLPLLAVEHGRDWPAHLDLTGMASFVVVLVSPVGLTVWEFDGLRLRSTSLPPGTHMCTAGPAEEGRERRHLASFVAAETSAQWQDLVASSVPGDDPDALLVRYPYDGATFATVFAQVIETQVGWTALAASRAPWEGSTWSASSWRSGRDSTEERVIREQDTQDVH